MKNVLKTSLALLFLISCLNLDAQKSEREIGLILNNLSDFGIVFKKQTGENRYLQLNALSLSTNGIKDDFNDALNIGAGFSIGFEKRKPITNKISFMHGFQPFVFVDYRNDFEQERCNYNINPGLGYMLGFIIDAGKNFRIGLQTAPNINFSFVGDNVEPVTNSVRWGLGLGNFNSSLMITYVFEKENG
jgi:hypothetical protein